MMKSRFIQAGFFAVLLSIFWPRALQAACDFSLIEPIVFTGDSIRIGNAKIPPVNKLIQGCTSKSKLQGLFDIVISEQRSGDKTIYYFLSGENEERVRTKTCGEYLAAIKKGMTTKTERDERLELSFRRTCGVLNALSNSIPAKYDFTDAKKNLSVEALPVIILIAPAPMGEPYEKLAADSEKEASFAGYLKDPNLFWVVDSVKNNPKKTYLETWYGDSPEDGNGFWLELEIIAKGDFNRDGYSDFLVHALKITNKGAWFNSDFFLLSSKDNSNKLYDIYGNGYSCVYKDKKYICNDFSKDKSLSSWSAFK